MTKTEALAEARRRWGPNAFAVYLRGNAPLGSTPPEYRVGVMNGDTHRPYGSGPSWTKAFRRADRTEAALRRNGYTWDELFAYVAQHPNLPARFELPKRQVA